MAFGWKAKRTKKGYSAKAKNKNVTANVVVARNKKGKKFAVIKINGKLSPTVAKRMMDSVIIK